MGIETRKDTYMTYITLFLRRYAFWLYEICIKPHSPDDEIARKELILNYILCGSIVLVNIFQMIIIYRHIIRQTYIGIPIGIFLTINIFFIATLILSRKNHPTLASYIVIVLYLSGTIFGALKWGPDLHQIILSFALLIIISGILLNPKVSLIITLLISGSIILINHLELRNVISINYEWKTHSPRFNDMVELSISYLMITLLSGLFYTQIRRSLQRARASEKALREKNESLEHIVEERTQALRQAQAEKISQLYRFAEFGKLSSGIFHDLMNPLSIVASNVEQLKTTLQPEMKDYVRRAVDASKRMEQFITTVRKHIQTDESLVEFILEEEIKEVISLLTYKARIENVSIKYTSSGNVLLYGNPVRFQQIMSNLISNAIDSFEASVLPHHERSIKVKSKKKQQCVEITVSDNGSGIHHTIIDKIFDPFFTTKGSVKGTGIGLSNTKNIVEKDFSGTISVSSTEHQGSLFTVILPLKNYIIHKNDQDAHE